MNVVQKPLPAWSKCFEILWVSLRLGCTSFGGPIAHLGYFHQEYVVRRQWLDDRTYAEVVALCQALPGPASSQVGMAIGMLRGGYLGAFLSWLGFTLPSALALMVVASVLHGAELAHAGWFRGLLIVAVAVVAHAIWGMARSLTPDKPRISIALLAAVIALGMPTPTVQLLLIIGGGVGGWLLFRNQSAEESGSGPVLAVSRKAAIIAWTMFFGLLVGLPILRHFVPTIGIEVFDSFYRVGSLVFGGGHVVLPLLSGEVVGPGWLAQEQFLAGYGAAQAVPGPLFTYAAYLGTAINGVYLGFIALVAIFIPSFLIVTGALPFWDIMRQRRGFQAALRGINAVVVGVLLAAWYDPIWTKAIHTSADFGLGLIAFGLLMFWKVPPWAVVIVSILGGIAMYGF